MGELIHDDEIMFTDKTLNDAKTGHPASRVNEDVGVPISFQFFLKLKVIPR